MSREVNINPNALFFWILKLYQENKDKIDPVSQSKRIVRIFNFGGTRSSKTYDLIQVIWMFCFQNKNAKLYIGVFRDTMVKCRDNTLKDFKECFDLMGLIRDIDYTLVEGQKIRITLYGNTIEFMGLPESGVQAARMDICYVNEILESDNWEIVKGLFQRTEMLVLADGNPSVTVHKAFEQKGFNVFYTDTTYLDNKHLREGLQADYESWCPWDFKDSHIEEYNHFEVNGKTLCFKRRVWDKPECPDGVLWTSEYRAVNETNRENGNIDKYQWLVYGEGQRCARSGSVFKPTWVNYVPDLEDVVFGLDFGYTNDKTVLTRVSREGMDVYCEYLTYQACRDTEILFDLIAPMLEKEEELRKSKAGKEDYPNIIVACDSSDKYKDIHFVRELNIMASQKGKMWQFVKVKKPHVTTRCSFMNRFRLHVLQNKEAETEFTNYVYDTVNGIQTNIPIDKFNHGIDSLGYAMWYFWRYLV